VHDIRPLVAPDRRFGVMWALETSRQDVISKIMAFRSFRRLAALGVMVTVPIGPALAQSFPTSSYTVSPIDPIDTLSMHLRTLAASPRNYAALIGAGDAALQVGDPSAALGFFARAEQVDPRSGKAKAGLAAALVALERPNDALPLFAQALSLGVSESEIARDRGLAYDLRGDTKSAQRDYALAMKRGADDETTRRYALSLGISGQRAEAMALLTPLLQKKDQSAWRARAFILAMTGDLSGANGIARQVMPANLAAAMTPFLTRLATLNPADRAHAVNFGTMPSNGVQMAAVQIGDPFTPVGGPVTPSTYSGPRGFVTPGVGQGTGSGLIPAGEPLGPKPVRVAERLSNDPRRIPGRESMPAPGSPAPATSFPAPTFPAPAAPGFTVQSEPPPPTVAERFARIGPVDPAKLPPEARGSTSPSVVVAKAVTLSPPGALVTAVAPAPVLAPKPSVDASTSDRPAFETTPTKVVAGAVMPAPLPAVEPAKVVAAAPPAEVVAEKPAISQVGPPAREVATVTPPPVQVETAAPVVATPVPAPAPVPVPVVATPTASRLASILEGVTPEPDVVAVALPTAAEIKAQRRLVAKKAEAAAALAAAAEAEKAERAAELAEAKANPARLWVQVATGSNTRGLGGTWARIRDANEAALKGKAAYSVPFKATNRLIVGPVKSPSEARALVNALAKGGVSATTFSSEAGQEVTRVSGK